ncbi:hypothetical protein Mpsy_3133 [Methanolobus psychrophilus R15]|nr:hypothetical protein Mpsy_3133 [Methanolobus psychrophilus R15]
MLLFNSFLGTPDKSPQGIFIGTVIAINLLIIVKNRLFETYGIDITVNRT